MHNRWWRWSRLFRRRFPTYLLRLKSSVGTIPLPAAIPLVAYPYLNVQPVAFNTPSSSSLMEGETAMSELTSRIGALRKDHGSMGWPKVSWRTLPDGAIDVWWTLATAVDSSEILLSLLNALGGELIAESACVDSKVDKPVLMFRVEDRKMEIALMRNGSAAGIYIRKHGQWRNDEIDAICQAYELTYVPVAKAASELSESGVRLYQPTSNMDWSDLAGYDKLAEEIRTTVIDATAHAEVFDEIMKMTRVRPESNKPRAVLFEGNPGTGKTSAAKIIASRGSLPLVFLPLQSIMSMYYGESEKTLAKIFDAVDKLGDAVIFIDEIDSLAPSRETDIHEASRRILSVLLQRIDGMEPSKRNSLIIAATNRKQDLDSALLSRFDVVIRFNDPDLTQRAKIYERYAKHLSEEEVVKLATKSEHLTGRDIRDVCAHAERAWGSKLIHDRDDDRGPALGQYTITPSPPPLEMYHESLRMRVQGLSS